MSIQERALNWFKRGSSAQRKSTPSAVPDGLWIKCKRCGQILYRKEVLRNLDVCPQCNFHMRIGSRRYAEILFDEGSFQEIGQEYRSKDFLSFVDTEAYAKRLQKATAKTGLKRLPFCVAEGACMAWMWPQP